MFHFTLIFYCFIFFRLIVVLKNSGEGDWKLASLVCQALWNFCIDSTHLYAALGVQPTNNLLAVLVDLLGITDHLIVFNRTLLHF